MLKVQSLDDFLRGVAARDPQQPEFMQAVQEVMLSLWPFIEKHPHYAEHAILERLVEPERVIQFRVCWTDDQGQARVNRASASSTARPSAPSRAACASIPR